MHKHKHTIIFLFSIFCIFESLYSMKCNRKKVFAMVFNSVQQNRSSANLFRPLCHYNAIAENDLSISQPYRTYSTNNEENIPEDPYISFCTDRELLKELIDARLKMVREFNNERIQAHSDGLFDLFLGGVLVIPAFGLGDLLTEFYSCSLSLSCPLKSILALIISSPFAAFDGALLGGSAFCILAGIYWTTKPFISIPAEIKARSIARQAVKSQEKKLKEKAKLLGLSENAIKTK